MGVHGTNICDETDKKWHLFVPCTSALPKRSLAHVSYRLFTSRIRSGFAPHCRAWQGAEPLRKGTERSGPTWYISQTRVSNDNGQLWRLPQHLQCLPAGREVHSQLLWVAPLEVGSVRAHLAQRFARAAVQRRQRPEPTQIPYPMCLVPSMHTKALRVAR